MTEFQLNKIDLKAHMEDKHTMLIQPTFIPKNIFLLEGYKNNFSIPSPSSPPHPPNPPFHTLNYN